MQRKDRDGGRSIEEVILRRKMGEEHIDLPLNASRTQSLPLLSQKQLPSMMRSQQQHQQQQQQQQMALLSVSHSMDSKGKRYSEEDVRQLMDESMRFARALQNRVHDLESELSRRQQQQPLDVSNTGRALGMSFELSRDSAVSSSSRVSQRLRHSIQSSFLQSNPNGAGLFSTAAMTAAATSGGGGTSFSLANEREAISEIDAKLATLREIFRKNDPIQERNEKLIRIQSLIRGFLVRCRYRLFRQAQREFYWIRCRPVIWLLDQQLAQANQFDSQCNLFTTNRSMHRLSIVFGKWARIAHQNAPMRKGMRLAAQERIDTVRKRALSTAFAALKQVTVGPRSFKQAKQQRKQLLERLRAEISAQQQERGLSGLVARETLQQALYRTVLQEFLEARRLLSLRTVFNAIVQECRDKVKRHETKALRYRFRRLVGRCFFAWNEFTFLQAVGIDRKRWPAPRKYEVRYNQKRVNNYSRVRCERMVFLAWKAYSIVRIKVNHMYQRKLTTFLIDHFVAWRQQSTTTRAMRRLVYDNWTGYAKLMVSKPFQAWAEYVSGLRNKFYEHARIARAYRQWKTRQKVGEIVRRWRHLALFGRLDGLYSRQMLLKSLGEQKIHAHSLEKVMSDQTIELEECKQLVLKETEKRKELETSLSMTQKDLQREQMQSHNLAQECERLDAFVNAIKKICPKQVEHLLEMQPRFRYRDRPVLYDFNSKKSGGGIGKSSKDQSEEQGDDENEDDENEHSGKSADGGDGTGEGGEAPLTAEQQEQQLHEKLMSAGLDLLESNEEGYVSADEKALEELKSGEDSGTSVTAGVTGSLVDATTQTSETPDAGNDGQVGMKILTGNDVEHPSGTGPVPHITQRGETLSIDDEKLLERTKWLVERYRDSLQDAEEAVEEAEATATSPENSQMSLDPDQSNAESRSKDTPIGSPVTTRKTAVPGEIENANLNRKSAVDLSKGNNLLRQTNPFLRSPSKSISAQISRVNTKDDIGAAVNSTVAAVKGSFRASFSRAIALNNNNGDLVKASEEYFNDEELEDTVITWAKMLFAFLEFLDNGDVTNLPAEDKRLWVRHLLMLSMSTGGTHNSTEGIPMDDWTLLPMHSMSGSRSQLPSTFQSQTGVGMQDALFSALRTVDQKMHGGVSWKEGLLRLRTMFPAAGNFAAFGQAASDAHNDHENALFRRLIYMHEHLRTVEDTQSRRYQRQFVARHRSPRIDSSSDVIHNTSINSTRAVRNQDSIAERDERQDSEWPPLGLNLYAGNLNKLKSERDPDEMT